VTPFAALAAVTGTATETFEHGPVGAIEIVLALLLAATGLALVARRVGIPYPILLVLGGLLVGFVPGIPAIELEPDVVFLLFLPPILFGAGYFTSIGDLKANLRAIGLLAVGLVLFTTAVVAVVVHALVPDLGWAPAFALGAIVAPPDAVAATSIFQRLGVPRRIVVILEGESLINDATALVAYRFAVAATLTGAFSLVDAGLSFVLVATGGIILGLAAGWIARHLTSRVDDPVFSVVITFLAPAAIYIPAERIGVSGVLAVVAAGIYLGRHAPRYTSSEVRLAGVAAWQVLLFLINGAVFILIGTQLPRVLEGLDRWTPAQLAVLALAVAATTILARILWVFPATYLPRRLSRKIRARDPYPAARNVFLVSWAGMRGVVSLAAALALPLALPSGEPFPERNLLIFLTFAVILATLVGQGLTLPILVRRLQIVADDGSHHDEAHARMATAEAAVERIDRMSGQWASHAELLDRLRAAYAHRVEHLDHDDTIQAPANEVDQERLEHREIMLSVVEAEREALLSLRDRGAITDEAFRRIERDLDLEQLRMDV
jgi:CPA1 family monovalent cation:H+ antiporter